MTAPLRQSLLVYNLLFPLVFLALLPGFLVRLLRRGNFRENFGQRFGRYHPAVRARFARGRWLWLHSISVGETLIALKLARELRAASPDLQIVISVTTSTGFALANEAESDWLAVIYNPIDARSFVRAALELVRPVQLVLIEGEAWPNLLAACLARDIPTALVNARLSPRSERRMRAGRRWIAPIFGMLDRIGVPEAEDVLRWETLGVSREKIHVTGSIKFDASGGGATERAAEFRELLAPLGVRRECPILLAGSTWEPEERTFAEVFLALRAEFPDLFLILVPRHVERSAELLRALAPLPLRIVRRSKLPTGGTADVLLVDTTGELRDWYALATVVFIGKSLPGIAQVGGQNPAEPAALGKPVLFGPHMENFAALAEHLCRLEAAVAVTDPAVLQREIAGLLRDPDRCAAMGIRARTALAAHAGATERTARLLLVKSPRPESGELYTSKLASNSAGVSVAVPSFPTTTPLAWLAISAASSGVAPALSASVKSAITVSPAPLTSKTSRARVGSVIGRQIRRERASGLARRA